MENVIDFNKAKNDIAAKNGVYNYFDSNDMNPKKYTDDSNEKVNDIINNSTNEINSIKTEEFIKDVSNELKNNSRPTYIPNLKNNMSNAPRIPINHSEKLPDEYNKLMKNSIGTAITKYKPISKTKISAIAKKIALLTLAGLIVYTYGDDLYKNHEVRLNAGTNNTIVSTVDGTLTKYETSPSEMATYDGEYIVKMQLANLLSGNSVSEQEVNEVVNSKVLEYMGIAAKRYVNTVGKSYDNAIIDNANPYSYEKTAGWLQQYYSKIIEVVSPICSYSFPDSVITYCEENNLNNKTSYNYLTNEVTTSITENDVSEKQVIKNLISNSNYLARQDYKDKTTEETIDSKLGSISMDLEYDLDENGNRVNKQYRIRCLDGNEYTLQIIDDNLKIMPVTSTKGER